MSRDRWEDDAACRRVPVEVFFVDPRKPAVAKARAVCAGCPVRAACLRAAMRWEGSSETRYRFGVWGGLTPMERHKLYARLAKERRARAQGKG